MIIWIVIPPLAGGLTVQDLQVGLNISHTYLSDLVVTLIDRFLTRAARTGSTCRGRCSAGCMSTTSPCRHRLALRCCPLGYA